MTGSPGAPDLIVVTDLDGTLLDEQTYTYAPARPALGALARRRIPLVLATSKTQAEVAQLASGLPMEVMVIVENGGAIIVPARALNRPPAGARREGDTFVMELGLGYDEVVRHLAGIAEDAGASVTGFASLTCEQVARLAGLPLAAATLAKVRRYDEPFVVADDGAVPGVVDAARRRGLRVTRGGRFLHLAGATSDKGRALTLLLSALAAEGGRFSSVGLGDAANDLPLLTAVDRPVIVPRPGGHLDPVLAAALPGAERAPAPGPTGWNAAVLAVLGGGALPRVGDRG